MPGRIPHQLVAPTGDHSTLIRSGSTPGNSTLPLTTRRIWGL